MPNRSFNRHLFKYMWAVSEAVMLRSSSVKWLQQPCLTYLLRAAWRHFSNSLFPRKNTCVWGFTIAPHPLDLQHHATSSHLGMCASSLIAHLKPFWRWQLWRMTKWLLVFCLFGPIWCLVHNEHLKRMAKTRKSAEVTIHKSPSVWKMIHFGQLSKAAKEIHSHYW